MTARRRFGPFSIWVRSGHRGDDGLKASTTLAAPAASRLGPEGARRVPRWANALHHHTTVSCRVRGPGPAPATHPSHGPRHGATADDDRRG